METFLPITYLNDFIFCPYSISLHQAFDISSEDLYSAKLITANHDDTQRYGSASLLDKDLIIF